ncbi:HlyD family efflux transporter periplasmic adaptor subunit [Roseisolibacter sp. H3M3-2]|uniref:HlyD family secretion protein n=1 Tax=Roseisolibacter sp. H3M3-2 TaxID=3031323 RepID=UPI0023DB6790|nr:HlyD family efflux transporter periplasmic adaptor subunit [Roseisolibacter sp. H3M3-2]MDF1505110.1 HlyD family efflux transporter periplasmic adaptor subunit [Roseisolibacter sp. H3M3-2]
MADARDAETDLRTDLHPAPAARLAGLHAVPAGIALESTRLLAKPRARRTLRRTVAGLLLAAAGALLLPWQQSVHARGELTALGPADRPQAVPAVIGGRIERWFVAEGQYVARGTPLVRLAEVKQEYLDPATLDRYREQLDAKRAAVGAKRDKAAALGEQLAALEQGLALGLEKARNSVALYAAAVDAAAADSAVAADQLGRRDALHRDGLASLNDLQAARLRAQQATARLVEKRQELASAQVGLRAVRAEYADKLAKTRADRAATLAEVSEGAAEASKLRNAADALAARAALYTVAAPQDGYVVQALRAGVGEQVKEGEAVVTIMPGRPRQAVALHVTGTDVPLLSPGRKVRLQFDGFPALQFSGWPAAAVGTFGGEIAVVDQVAGPDGRYRVLVRPDTTDAPWPAPLRQGSGVLGWAMLDEVRLGYELWRRLNGFPPALRQAPADAAGGKQ